MHNDPDNARSAADPAQAGPRPGGLAISKREPPLALLLQCLLPIAVGWSFALTLRHALGIPFAPWGLTLFLAGIGAAYTVDRLIDPAERRRDRLQQARMPRWLHRTLWSAALCFSGVTLLAALRMPRSLQTTAFILSAASLAYPLLKRLPLAKTAAIALAWTWASGSLPFPVSRIAPWWRLDLALPLFLLVAANAILCDLKDREHDREDGIPAFPVLFGPRATCLAATGMLAASVALALSRGCLALAASGAALAIVAQFPQWLGHEIAGPLLADALLILPGLLIQAGAI